MQQHYQGRKSLSLRNQAGAWGTKQGPDLGPAELTCHTVWWVCNCLFSQHSLTPFLNAISQPESSSTPKALTKASDPQMKCFKQQTLISQSSRGCEGQQAESLLRTHFLADRQPLYSSCGRGKRSPHLSSSSSRDTNSIMGPTYI